MRVSAFICDECKISKGVSNHWWLAWLDSLGNFHACPWNQETAIENDKRHLCGQECVHKSLDRWMATGQLTGDIPQHAPVYEFRAGRIKEWGNHERA